MIDARMQIREENILLFCVYISIPDYIRTRTKEMQNKSLSST